MMGGGGGGGWGGAHILGSPHFDEGHRGFKHI